MILSGMDLFYQSANSRAVWPNQYKQVSSIKAHFLIAIDDLNMRQPLSIGTHFVLAFNDECSISFENPGNFFSRPHIKIQNSRMPFCSTIVDTGAAGV